MCVCVTCFPLTRASSTPSSSSFSVNVSRRTSLMLAKGKASWVLMPNALLTKPTIVSKTYSVPDLRERPETRVVFIIEAIATESGTLKRRRTLSSLAAESSMFLLPGSRGCAAPRGASGISALAALTMDKRCVTLMAMCL